MSWSSLPDEMVRQILGKLPLVQLARITTACRSFHTFYCEKIVSEQEASPQLAVNFFGSQRIACLCALIVRLLEKEPCDPDFVATKWNRCWISADGVLHRQGSLPDPPMSEDICVEVPVGGPWRHVAVRARDRGPRYLLVEIAHHRKRVVIDVRDVRYLKPVSLVQALLAGGLARSILDVGYQAEIHIGRWDEQIATLLPFASRYVPQQPGGYNKRCMLIGVRADDRHITLLYCLDLLLIINSAPS